MGLYVGCLGDEDEKRKQEKVVVVHKIPKLKANCRIRNTPSFVPVPSQIDLVRVYILTVR
jgi:hypothetical protein